MIKFGFMDTPRENHITRRILEEEKFLDTAYFKAKKYYACLKESTTKEEYMWSLDRIEAFMLDLKVCHRRITEFEDALIDIQKNRGVEVQEVK